MAILISYLAFGLASASTAAVLPWYICKRHNTMRLIRLNLAMSFALILSFITFMILDFGGTSRLFFALKNPSPNSITRISFLLSFVALILHLLLIIQIFCQKHGKSLAEKTISFVTIIISIAVLIFISQLQTIFIGNSIFSYLIGSITFIFGLFFASQLLLYIILRIVNKILELKPNDFSVAILGKQVRYVLISFVALSILWKFMA